MANRSRTNKNTKSEKQQGCRKACGQPYSLIVSSSSSLRLEDLTDSLIEFQSPGPWIIRILVSDNTIQGNDRFSFDNIMKEAVTIVRAASYIADLEFDEHSMTTMKVVSN